MCARLPLMGILVTTAAIDGKLHIPSLFAHKRKVEVGRRVQLGRSYKPVFMPA